jgi:hypothetical protein
VKRPALVRAVRMGRRGRIAIGDALLEELGTFDGDPTHAELYSCRDVLANNGYEITTNELAYMYVEALARSEA